MEMGSIYNPGSTSYEARISALQSVLKARREVQISKMHLEETRWMDALGGRSEIEEAEHIVDASLSIAATDFQKDELKKALEEGEISDGELSDVMAAAHRHEMDDRRSNSSADQNNQSDEQS